ncbi:hypothetical protein DCC81_03550 [Chitinophaga parva]|uniref:HTH cro/C1-type domain-containing protein n=1 Tax=Chitinophaga parva TaxID=2169414 RepID=A0A2T7BLP8_9BACT|nr:hypothetical protein [Chitinophaga parva]PUZ28569.1 hypothetical protein DCC81_03550 [Chitinophaga parva]
MKVQQEFEVVRLLITGGHIGSFEQIFKYVYRSHVFKKMGINSKRFSRLIKCPSEFKLREINIMAHLFGITPKMLLELIYRQIGQTHPVTMPIKPSAMATEPAL